MEIVTWMEVVKIISFKTSIAHQSINQRQLNGRTSKSQKSNNVGNKESKNFSSFTQNCPNSFTDHNLQFFLTS